MIWIKVGIKFESMFELFPLVSRNCLETQVLGIILAGFEIGAALVSIFR